MAPRAAPASLTVADLEHWLLREAARETEMVLLFESFVWRMVAAGLPLDRASVHIGTLHPQLIGFAWNWLINDGLCDEVKVAEATNTTDSYTQERALSRARARRDRAAEDARSGRTSRIPDHEGVRRTRACPNTSPCR